MKFDFNVLVVFLTQLFNAIKAFFEALTGTGGDNGTGDNENDSSEVE